MAIRMKNPSAMSSVTIFCIPFTSDIPEKMSVARGVSLAVSVVTSCVEADGVVLRR